MSRRLSSNCLPRARNELLGVSLRTFYALGSASDTRLDAGPDDSCTACRGRRPDSSLTTRCQDCVHVGMPATYGAFQERCSVGSSKRCGAVCGWNHHRECSSVTFKHGRHVRVACFQSVEYRGRTAAHMLELQCSAGTREPSTPRESTGVPQVRVSRKAVEEAKGR